MSSYHATRLSPAHVQAVAHLITSRGLGNALRLLGTTPSTVDRVLGPGVLTRAAAERLERRIDELGAGP